METAAIEKIVAAAAVENTMEIAAIEKIAETAAVGKIVETSAVEMIVATAAVGKIAETVAIGTIVEIAVAGKIVETAPVGMIWTGWVEEHFGRDQAELVPQIDLDEVIVGGDECALGLAEGNDRVERVIA
jgi:hypothetical protein